MALEFGEGHVVPEEVLLGEMSRQFDVENLELVEGVEVVKADEEPLGNDLLNRYRALR